MKIHVSEARAIAAVLPAMAQKDTRFYLNGIHFARMRDDSVRITATNGHILAQVRDCNGAFYSDEYDDLIVRFPREALQAIRKKGNADVPVSLLIKPGESLAIAVHVGSTTFVAERVDGTYPDTARVLPSDDSLLEERTGYQLPAFDHRYLAAASKTFEALKPNDKYGCTRVFTPGQNSMGPAVLRPVGDPDEIQGFVVIMPVRVDEPISMDALPPWARDGVYQKPKREDTEAA